MPGAGAIEVPVVVFCVSLGEFKNGLSRRGQRRGDFRGVSTRRSYSEMVWGRLVLSGVDFVYGAFCER